MYCTIDASSVSMVGRILLGDGGPSMFSGSININWLLWRQGGDRVHIYYYIYRNRFELRCVHLITVQTVTLYCSVSDTACVYSNAHLEALLPGNLPLYTMWTKNWITCACEGGRGSILTDPVLQALLTMAACNVSMSMITI